MRRRLLPLLLAAVSSLLVVELGAELSLHYSMLTISVKRGPGSAVAQDNKAGEKKSEVKSGAEKKKPTAKTASGTVKSSSVDSLVVAAR